ncbi:MAG: hypothetical protein PHQ60_03865 [Sideroxydans sp.]|nr:hypothetical protein [Sideroxydans sp.]
MLLKPALRKATELGIGLTAIATLILAGCGGGGGTTTGGGASTVTASVTPYKGPYYSGATVVLKDASGNPITLVSGGTVNASGVASVTFPASVTYPLIVEVTGSYFNEVTGAPETGSTPLRGLIQSAGAAATGVPVTLVTETAVTDLQTRLGGFSAAHPIQAASAVAAMSVAGTIFGVPASAVPAFDPATNHTGDTNTLLLSAWAMAANGQSGTTLADRAQALATGLVNPASAPTSVVSQATFDAALLAMTSGASSVMAAGASAPSSPAIPTATYGALYASAVAAGSTIPSAPTGVSATASSATQININWTNVTGATAYNIYRSTTSPVQIIAANKITPVIAQPTSGPFPNTGLTAATTYYYRMTAVNAAGESAGSAEVNATTSAAGGGAPAALNWTAHSVTGITLLQGYLSDVAWSGTQYLSVGVGNKVASSTDAVTWGSLAATYPGATPASAALILTKVAYGNGVFVGVDNYGQAYTSPDGALWTGRLSAGNYQNKNGVDFANGKFFLTDGGGGILTSADGITWSTRIVPAVGTLNKVIWSGTQYVAVGSRILTSPDAVTWTDRGQITYPGYPVLPQNAINLGSVVFANNLYVAAGTGVWTSPDAITWTAATPASAVYFNTLNMVAYGNGSFVAAGTSGKVFTSTDGLNWTQDASTGLSGVGVTSLKFLNNTFMAVGGVQIFTTP